MALEYLGPTGSEELQNALQELVEVARRSVESYRLTEEVVEDHWMQAALERLRLHHERHAEELAALMAELGGRATADGTVADAGPVGNGAVQGEVTRVAVLEELRRAETELCMAYQRHSGRGYLEPVQTVLMRHRREEEAHEAWLRESELWQANTVEEGAGAGEPRRPVERRPADPTRDAREARSDARVVASEPDAATAAASQWASRSPDAEEGAV